MSKSSILSHATIQLHLLETISHIPVVAVCLALNAGRAVRSSAVALHMMIDEVS